MTYIVQLFTGAAGSVAFGILFHMKKKHLPLAALGGFLGWLLFIICRGFWGGVFFPTLAAAFGIDLYAEILDRIKLTVSLQTVSSVFRFSLQLCGLYITYLSQQ